MSERRPAQTIGELDIHLSNVQLRLSEIALAMQGMATKADVDRIEKSMAQLATKAELDAEVKAIRDELQRTRPGTLLKQAVTLLAAVAIAATVFGIAAEIFRVVDRIPK